MTTAHASSPGLRTSRGNDFDLPPDEVIFGRSAAAQNVGTRIARLGRATLPVLLRGESGTGKELVAKLIHCRTFGIEKPFVKVPCPAIPASLLESELFGYERGAFTGAYAPKRGLVEMAEHGTLFLDEIAELDLGLQSKLLHLLQDGHFLRIGGNRERCGEFRVVCATNRKLEHEIERGTFRSDLYYRIGVIVLELPPLRARRPDIPILADYFLEKSQREQHRVAAALRPEIMDMLVRYDWPGNIRELENLIRGYVALGAEVFAELARAASNRVPAQPDGRPVSLKGLTRQAARQLEHEAILHALIANNWNRKAAARDLDISYRTLFYKLKEAGIAPKRRLNGEDGARTA